MEYQSLSPNIGVKDVAETVRFYTEILGLEKKFEFAEQGMIAFKVGEKEPAIILKDKNKMPGTVPTIWIEVEDARALCEKLKVKGVKFLTEPFRIRTGWAVEFADPFLIPQTHMVLYQN